MKKALLILTLSLLTLSLFAANKEGGFWNTDQALMLMPTAYTMPKGMHSLTSFEIAILQYSYAAANRAHLSAGMLFPVTKDAFKTFSVGGKLNYFDSELVDSAIWTTYNLDQQVLIAGNTVSIGYPKASMHLMVADAYNSQYGEHQFILGAGGINSFGSRFAGIAELYYLPPVSNQENDIFDDGYKGVTLGMLGMRFKSKLLNVDLGFFRPLNEDDWDNLFALPWLRATIMF